MPKFGLVKPYGQDCSPKLISLLPITKNRKSVSQSCNLDAPCNYTGISVQSIKLEILHSSNLPLPVPPGHKNDDTVGMEQTEQREDSDGLDDEPCSFFPATIQYLDLQYLV